MGVYQVSNKNPSRANIRLWKARLIGLTLLLTLMSVPQPTYAQWPPFSFKLDPFYENGRIVYQVGFSKRVEGPMMDVTFKIPLPEGTRFVEAGAPSATRIDFDGQEVTFFTAISHRSISDTYFVVEVVDPAMTVFTTYAWIAWQGEQAGNYVTEAESFDITLTPLNWTAPPRTAVQLEATATVADDTITYILYPFRTTSRRIWDLKVNMLIPPGTTFLSAEAPAQFVASFDGQEVSFSTIEMSWPADEVSPLKLKVSTTGLTTPLLTTQAQATWKNVGRRVGQTIPAQEETMSGEIIVQPHGWQRVRADTIGDVPFANYDVSSLALEQDEGYLKIIFRTVGEVGPVGEPLEYHFFIDTDCRIETGKPENERGVEYRVRYRHGRGQTDLDRWDEAQAAWIGIDAAELTGVATGKMVTLSLPIDLVDNPPHFCWTAEAKSRVQGFQPSPPTEKVADGATAGWFSE